MDIERQFVDTGTTRWAYREAGSGEPLVLLHGGGGTGKAFLYQMEHLAARCRVICPDLPGFGQSDWVPGALTVDGLADPLLAWMDALGLDQVTLGGNSMGGRVALATALRAPHRIRGLILLDAVGVLIPGLPPRNPLEIPQAQYIAAMVHDPDRYRRTTPYRSLEDARELNAGRQAFRRYLTAAPIGPDRSLELASLTMPVLLIWGRHDQIVPLDYGRALARLLPLAELNVLETAGHLPHIEEPDLVNRLISDFLDRLAP
jgi:2-hydroxy-6-oxonona-2,4-dienedioate hydrolase